MPGLLTYGCWAHALQSFGKSVSRLQRFQDSLGSANSIIVYFRKHTQHGGLASLREIRSTIAKETKKRVREFTYATETRWHSSFDSVHSLIGNRRALNDLLLSESWGSDPAQAEISKFIHDHALWQSLSLYETLASPVKDAIKTLEADESSLSDVYACIIALDAKIQAHSCYSDVQGLLLRRMTCALSDVHVVAYLLDPRFAPTTTYPSFEGSELIETVFEKAFPNTSTNTDLSIEISRYFDAIRKHQTDPQSPSLWRSAKGKTTTGLHWWAKMNSKFPTMHRLASRLLSLPSTATSAERVWSAAGVVINPRRSSLLPENANKQLYVYFNEQMPQKSNGKPAPEARIKFLELATTNIHFNHFTSFLSLSVCNICE
jgi:hypothetical protein